SYTAAAFYHKKLAADLQADLHKTLHEAEEFALNDYAAALARGTSLESEKRKSMVSQLSKYTSLSEDVIARANLRIEGQVFQKQLLASERKIVGRFDARITGFALDPLSNYAEYDPSFSPYFAPYSSTFNDYVRRALNFKSDLPYEFLSGRVHPWNFGK